MIEPAQIIALIIALINLIIAVISMLSHINITPSKFWKIMFSVSTTLFLSAMIAYFIFSKPTPSIQITYPEDMAEIQIDEMVKGISDHLPDGQKIWMVLYSHPVSRYYPQENAVEMEMTGNWSSRCHIGIPENTDIKFDIIAVLADKNLQEEFRDYHFRSYKENIWPGFEELPDNAKVYHRITVIRK